MGREGRHSLAGSFGSGFLIRLPWSCRQGLQSFVSKLKWWKSHFQVTHVIAGRLQFLVGCWTEGFLAGTGWRLPSMLCPVDLSIGQLNMKVGFMRVSKLEEKGRVQDRNSSFVTQSQNRRPIALATFCSLTACYKIQLTCVVFIIPTCWITEGHEYQHVGIIGTILQRLPTYALLLVWVKICTLNSCSTF